jgi:hypothetical protein
MDLIFDNLPVLFVTAFFAILFLQSGLDKILDYQAILATSVRILKTAPWLEA